MTPDPEPDYKMVYHDFDYINPETQQPHGNLSIDYQKLRAMAETSTKSFDPLEQMMKSTPGRNKFGKNSSPGKSVYMASEKGSDKRKSRMLGGQVTNLRAL